MSKYLAFSTIQIMDSELILYLFYDKDFPLILPPPYNEVEPEGNCACLQACDDMAELNDELALTGRMLKQVQGQGLSLSLVRPSGLICNFCSYGRDFPSNFLSHGSSPPRSCSSGLGFRIIAAPCGLSPQCAYRVGRTGKSPRS